MTPGDTNTRATELRRRVRDRGEAIRGARFMFQQGEMPTRKFRHLMKQFHSQACSDRTVARDLGVQVFVPLPTEV
jgi:hypothetical protein